MIQAVFFDLYGTLIDVQTCEEALPPYERLAEWMADRKLKASPAALQKTYLEEVGRLKASQTDADAEIDIQPVFEKLLVSCGVARPPASQVTELAWAFRRFTRTRCQLIPGANDLIQRLRKDYRLAIVANAQKLFTRPELEELRMLEPFEAIILSSETGLRKPSLKMFEVALQSLEVAPDEAVFVGDSIQEDIAGAKQTGMRTLLYSPSGVPQAGADEPDGRLKRIAEVAKYLEDWYEPLDESAVVDDILDEED